MHLFLLITPFIILGLHLDLTYAVSDGLFYIYEWPDVPISMYPKPEATLFRNSSYSHGFNGNHGVGDTINKDIGLFNSWQFSMFRSLFNRLYVHPRRTRYVLFTLVV